MLPPTTPRFRISLCRSFQPWSQTWILNEIFRHHSVHPSFFDGPSRILTLATSHGSCPKTLCCSNNRQQSVAPHQDGLQICDCPSLVTRIGTTSNSRCSECLVFLFVVSSLIVCGVLLQVSCPVLFSSMIASLDDDDDWHRDDSDEYHHKRQFKMLSFCFVLFYEFQNEGVVVTRSKQSKNATGVGSCGARISFHR